MKKVFLTSGPRGSGKSTLVKSVVMCSPSTQVVSRDEILLSIFGKTSLSPYTNGHGQAIQEMFRQISTLLARDLEEQIIILDCWNGFSRDRKSIISKLRNFGADEVSCLFFTTPLDFCIKWFLQKSDAQGYSESSVRWDYRLYHKEARDIRRDGFDNIFDINPLQLFLYLTPTH